ncbi:MAG: adenylate/guanylate cyclase domain-containing protein [Proteobacteria bacterium]|nr:MAG: adenylate/guanylate cyclase domain-containing protein [Pseudomonadota bacterium]
MRHYLTRALLGLVYMAVVLCDVAGVFSIPYFERLEHIAYDTRLRLTMSQELDPRVVIVDIDERSLQMEGQWPWGRDKIARLIEKLTDVYFADVVAFDILFAEPQASHDIAQVRNLALEAGDQRVMEALQPYLPKLDRDRRFAQALEGRRVVLGYFFHTDPDYSGGTGKLPPPLFDDDGTAVGVYAPGATGYSANLPVLEDAALGAGFFSNPLVDSDGIYRRAPLLHEFDGNLYESLSLAATRHYLGLDVEPGVVRSDDGQSTFLEYLLLGPLQIPIDQNGAVLVPFSGPSPGYPYVSATDVLNENLEDPDAMAGSIVMIGTGAAGLVDLRPTPVQNVYPGVEIHANVISGILDGTIKQRPGYTVAAEILAVLVFGVVGALALPLLSPIVASVATWLLIGADIGLNMYFWQQSQLLPLMSSLLLIFGLYVLNMFYGFFVESRTRAQLRGLFGQYVPPELVDEMNKDPAQYNLDSRKQELTVLFTDVRGFTSISESLDPDELARLMNEFLTPMTRIVHKHRGTIDKYMGDAMMAFWGAPIEEPEHASHAVAAGLEMVEILESLQQSFRDQGWPEVRIGVGLNTGPMNVGNMGSEFRMAYTVLGDAVNLGSRLEGLTRQYGVDVIVSEATAVAAPEYLYRKLDVVRVKGKTRPITIYQPVALRADADESQVRIGSDIDDAVTHYLDRNWDEAARRFEALRSQEPGVALYDIYLARIESFKQTPPPPEWDGVFEFRTK